jgi:ketosteroid isomerase-like protein
MLRALLVIACAWWCASCSSSAHAFSPSDSDAIKAVLQAQQDGWNRGDLDAFMAGYEHTTDLVFTSGGNIHRGWQETFDRYRAKYGSDKTGMGHLDFDVLGVQPLGADGAIVLGKWRLTATPNAGEGVFSLGFARGDAGWKIVHDHTSLAPANAGSASGH